MIRTGVRTTRATTTEDSSNEYAMMKNSLRMRELLVLIEQDHHQNRMRRLLELEKQRNLGGRDGLPPLSQKLFESFLLTRQMEHHHDSLLLLGGTAGVVNQVAPLGTSSSPALFVPRSSHASDGAAGDRAASTFASTTSKMIDLLGGSGTSSSSTTSGTTTSPGGALVFPNRRPSPGTGRGEPFPEKVHRLLRDVEFVGRGDVVSFVADDTFRIHDPATFFKEVVPQYFRQSKLTSFKRQLKLYGFELLTKGHNIGGYRHKLFSKKDPALCRTMKRVAIKGQPGATRKGTVEEGKTEPVENAKV